MDVLNFPQGSAGWHAARAKHFCASEAAAALGVSKYTTRDELLRQKATGITEEVGAAKQRIFDAGHEAEALARPIAEGIADTEFYPVVATLEVEGMALLASFDGIDLLDEVIWENKLLNQSLVEQVQAGDLEPHYFLQLEHQLLVSGAARALFTTSDGTPEGTHPLWYESKPERRAQLIAGWKQFAADLAAYVPPDAPAPKIVAEAVTALPAVFAQVTGSLALKDNLPEYEAALRDFIDHRLIRKPETDQDFANLDLQIKALKGAEAALDASEEQALSQAEMLSAFKRQKDMLHALTRDTRLAAEKQLAAEKERIKLDQVQRGQKEFAAHIAGLNTSLGKPYMPPIPADFAGAIKGKRTVDSLRGAVNDELARAKIAADEVANRIQRNLGTLRELASGHVFLFADTGAIVLKDCDDLTMLVKSRIAEHDAKEAARLEAERERIRAEEAARLQRESDAKARAEAAELARQQEEACAQQQREDQAQRLAEAKAVAAAQVAIAQAATPAPAPVALSPAAAPAAQERADDDARVNLGSINYHLAPIKLDAAGLMELGFYPVATVKASKLYRASDLPAIRSALVKLLSRLAELEPQT